MIIAGDSILKNIDQHRLSKTKRVKVRRGFLTLHQTTVKGELQRENDLISYERAYKMLEKDMYITVIGQAFLQLLSFKVGSENLLTSEIFGNLRKYESHFTENEVISDKS